MTIFYVFSALLLLGILITVHEFGHFIAARLTGMDVMEFSVGFGPLIWQKKGKKTDFSLRAIPLGGYCAFYGEADPITGEPKDDERSYTRQPVWKRMISVLMGPGMNFILAFVVATMFYWIGGIDTVQGYTPYIADVAGAGPAYSAGIQAGDIIETINGRNILDGTMDTFLNAISDWKEGDAPLAFTAKRGEETLSGEMIPFWDEEMQTYRVGITVGGRAITQSQPCTLGQAIRYSFDWCVYVGHAIFDALKNLVTTGEGLNETAGPVGMVKLVTEQVRMGGFEAFISLLIFISINLGVMNLLPIPGLDGSRFLFMLVEAVRRKPIEPKKEALVHLAGYILLLGLMIILTWRDITSIFH